MFINNCNILFCVCVLGAYDIMENKVDFIVKLGGSAVTHKNDFETENLENIVKGADVLVASWRKGKRFIIVHGAG